MEAQELHTAQVVRVAEYCTCISERLYLRYILKVYGRRQDI